MDVADDPTQPHACAQCGGALVDPSQAERPQPRQRKTLKLPPLKRDEK